jgi:cytochrome c oxidase subunit II
MTPSHAAPTVERNVLVVSLLFMGAMIGLLGFAAVRLGVSVPGCVTNVKPFKEGSLTQLAPGRYEAHVIAKTFSFQPSPITVPRGSVVDFYVTSKDVVHGFAIEGTNVNLTAIPGVVTYAQARFDEPRKIVIACHEFCGEGHQEMTGIIEVTP